ncbi:probable carboxylesterase 7 [Cornus florida]|uniref:probable carboxylesterase 7 n=1 Tax=Cornus florida TaxID=4283 RepID=UPI00289B2416|nr:probable carboxylesterase 7 [Cornus florida]
MGYKMSPFLCLFIFFSVASSASNSSSNNSSSSNSDTSNLKHFVYKPANNSSPNKPQQFAGPPSSNSKSSDSNSTNLKHFVYKPANNSSPNKSNQSAGSPPSNSSSNNSGTIKLHKFDATPFLPLFHGGVLHIGGFMNIYKNNTLERIKEDHKNVPPSFDSRTGVTSKDVEIIPENGITGRLYIPVQTPGEKFPLVVYVHGGGFVTKSAASPEYHNYVNLLVANASVVALSVNYRQAPEHPLPVAYQDTWSALKWVAKHSNGSGTEAWLNDYVDFKSVYLVGDGAGGNIAHNVAMWAGQDSLDGMKLAGMVLFSPLFWGKDIIGEHEPKDFKRRTSMKILWYVSTEMIVGLDDPWLNPIKDPNLSKLGVPRLLVCISENEMMRDRGEYYTKALRTSGWKGEMELHETTAESHAYQLTEPDGESARALLTKVSSFINKEP